MIHDDLWTTSEREVTRIGIPVAYKGYYYLILAVVLSLKAGVRKASLSKEIYSRIAEINDVTKYSVEKDIRNVLLKAWMNDGGGLRKMYPNHNSRPSNGEVIAGITSRIRLETAPGI